MSGQNPTDDPYPDLSEIQNHVSTLVSSISSCLPSISPTLGERSARSDTEEHSSFPTDEPGVTKEECVHHLLEVNSGRIYQADVVESTDWSKSTVSRVLQEMEQVGEIERYSVGRQKVVCNSQSVPGRIERSSFE